MPALSRRAQGDTDSSLSTGAIVGIIVAIVVVFLILAGLLVWRLLQYRKERNDPRSTTNAEKRARQRAIALSRAEKHLATSRTTGNYGPGTVIPPSPSASPVGGEDTAVNGSTEGPASSRGHYSEEDEQHHDQEAVTDGQHSRMTSTHEPVTAEVMHNPEGLVEARAIENRSMAQPSDFNEQDGEPWKGKRNWRSMMGRKASSQRQGDQPLIQKEEGQSSGIASGGPEDDHPEPPPGQGKCAHM